MKVLLWSELFWPAVGGIEVLTAQLLPALEARGHQFRVVTSSYLDLPADDALGGIPIERLPLRQAVEEQNPVEVMRLRQTIAAIRAEYEPDLEHLFGIGTTLLFQREVSAHRARPYLITLQNALPEQVTRERDGLVQHTLRDAAWVVACSEILLENSRRIVPDIADHSSAIVNSVAVPALEPGPLPIDPPSLLCIGRLNQQKGFDVALDAFALFAERYPAVRLRIAGDGTDRQVLIEQARDLRLAGRVDFIGLVPPAKVPRVLDQATIVLMPSRWEGLPVLAVEAAMMGRPIVGTGVDGIPEVVLHERTGLIVPPEDPAALAAATTRLLDDLDEAAVMGRAARAHATAAFSLEVCADAYDALYHRFSTQR